MSMVSFVDGNLATVVTRQSHDDTAFYDDVWFDSTFPDGEHELVIQNSGGPSDSPFQLDRFIVTGSVVPVQGEVAPPESPTAPLPTSSSPSPTTTLQSSTTEVPTTPATTASSLSTFHPSSTYLPSVTSSSTGTSSSSMSRATGSQTTGQSHFLPSEQEYCNLNVDPIQHHHHRRCRNQQTQNSHPVAQSTFHPKQNVGMIVGGVLGGILFLLFLLRLLVFCWRRCRRPSSQISGPVKDSERGITVHSTTSITPFMIGDPRWQSDIDSALSSDSEQSTCTIGFPVGSLEHTASSRPDIDHVNVNEKDGHLFRDARPDSYTVATSNSTGLMARISRTPTPTNPTPSPIKTKPWRIRSILKDTLSAHHLSADMLPPHKQLNPPQPLRLQDINDTPPSYESSRNRDSYPIIHVQTHLMHVRSVFVGSG
ncbi:hypothetical protein CPC08DRAFT_770770 [Agrocybe pediades]|nr:hypothetical protein CPC08DRAFT_770770 [Agrocybe pediades]